MKSMPGEKTLEEIRTRSATFKPEIFLRANSSVSEESLQLLKCLYDFTKVEESEATAIQNMITFTNISSGSKRKKKKHNRTMLSKTEQPLSKLIIDDFDGDQIWEELQLQNNLMYETLISSASIIMAKNNSLRQTINKEDLEFQNIPTKRQKLSAHLHQKSNFSDDEDELDDDSSEIEFEGNVKKAKKKVKSDKLLESPNGTNKYSARTYAKSIVDDKFFNLAQMNEFLESVESQLEKPEPEELDSEDDIDLFADIGEDETQEDNPGEEEGAHNLFYKKYFDDPIEYDQEEKNEDDIDAEAEESGEEGSEDDADADELTDENKSEGGMESDSGNEGVSKKKKKVRFSFPDKEDDSESQDEEMSETQDDHDDDKEDNQPVTDNPSNFEKRRRKIEENIQSIEEAALESKPWKYLGEITAEKRPENSLLEEHLVYDSLVRPAPEITVETTQKLEDIIKQRIKDKAWDDVERKIKPIEDPHEFKKKLVLNAEKSKMSLAQIYEQEYIDKKKAEEGEAEAEAKPEEELIIERDLKSLFAKLDALSNFYYTPKPASAEIKIITNLPSIALEEVAPVNVADSTLLAPHEIQEPIKGDIKGKAERTDTDRKHERRVKKKKQKLKQIAREERAKLKGTLIPEKIKGKGKRKEKQDTAIRKNQIKFK